MVSRFPFLFLFGLFAVIFLVTFLAVKPHQSLARGGMGETTYSASLEHTNWVRLGHGHYNPAAPIHTIPSKKILLPKGVVDHLAFLSQARLPVGAAVELHSHESMQEIFMGVEGTGVLVAETGNVTLTPGVVGVVRPRVLHALVNIHQTDPLMVNVMGVIV